MPKKRKVASEAQHIVPEIVITPSHRGESSSTPGQSQEVLKASSVDHRFHQILKSDLSEETDSSNARRAAHLDDAVIRRRLSSFLPSNTILRSKRAGFDAQKLSHPAILEDRMSIPELTLDDKRLSSTRRPTLLKQRKETARHLSGQSIDEVEIPLEELSVEDTDEERIAQLEIIRSLPIPMKEKRKMRDDIISKIGKPRARSIWVSKQKKAKKNFQHFLREFASLFDIWSDTFKIIEGHFGTAMVSYFVFMRFLLFLNTTMFLLFTLFVVLPQWLGSAEEDVLDKLDNNSVFYESFEEKYFKISDENVQLSTVNTKPLPDDLALLGDIGVNSLGSLLDYYISPDFLESSLHYDKNNFTNEKRINISRYCSVMYKAAVKNKTKLSVVNVIQDFLQGSGWMEQTLLFIGHYTRRSSSLFGFEYNLAVAFLSVLMIILVVSVFMMINFTSQGIQETLLSTEGNVDNYSNLLFCAWDYCIEDEKTASLKHKSIVLEMKSTLAEARRRAKIETWSASYKVKLYSRRFLINCLVIAILLLSYYLIYASAVYQWKEVTQHRLSNQGFHTLVVQFLCPVVITFLNFIMIFVFEFLVIFEKYHAVTEINVSLARIVVLRLTTLIVLVSTFYFEITCEPQNMCGLGMSAECTSPMCWETYVGQQLYKLVVTDFFIYIAITFAYDLPRDYIVQKWHNRVTDLVGRQIFDLPSQVLALLYSQTLGWLGMFYCPLLPFVNVVKIFLIFYLKKISVVKSCQPDPIAYKASRSNAIFVLILFVSFFFVLIVLGYSVSSLEPSPGCSPFRIYINMMAAFPDAMKYWSPSLTTFLRFVFSMVFYVPAAIFLGLAIYYHHTVARAHKRMINILKEQMVLEARDKQFLLSRVTEAVKQSTNNP